MGLETGNYVDDLDVSNPPGGDSKSQGDNHLRLIKTVLRNTLKRASKAFSFPGSVSKSANYTILSTDDNLTILCDTTAAFTLTLPTLVTGDAGWCVFIIKTTTDANPVYIAPPSGTINGYTKVRRSVEFAATRVMWTGSVFVATRPFGDAVGTSVDYHGSTLPNGYLWADGATFTAVDYVELNTVLGGNTKPDLRGRAAFGRDNMGVGAASRLTNAAVSGITGATLGSGGGAETDTLTVAKLPSHTPTGTIGSQSVSHTHTGTTNTTGSGHNHTVTDPGHTHQLRAIVVSTTTANAAVMQNNNPNTVTGDFTGSSTTGVTVNSADGTHTHTFTTDTPTSTSHTHSFTGDAIGSGGAHNNLPPALIVNKIVVAE